MTWSSQQKDALKQQLKACFSQDEEVQRVVVFGSFLTSDQPNDMDVAVFQSSDESYLTLAMKYRRQARAVSRQIPLDIVPLKAGVTDAFLAEIEQGETVYAR